MARRVEGSCTLAVLWVEPLRKGSADGSRLVDTVVNHSIAGDNIPEPQGTARSSITCFTEENKSSNFGSHYRCFHHLVTASSWGSLTDHTQGAPSSCSLSHHGRHSG
jgi:hypothetical protein